MQDLADTIAKAVGELRRRYDGTPKVGMILGTGLGGVGEAIRDRVEFPYGDIPGFPRSTSPGHAGRLVAGTFEGVPVVAMEGRFHSYEGYSLREVTFPVRVMKALGAEILIVTNAAGGMNPQYDLGDLMLIEDHINLMPDNPLRGVNDDGLGPRFPDMSEPYDRKLLKLAQDTARDLAIPFQKGVFVAVPGPNLETRAEYRMLRGMGADAVGMSTVPEVIVARHAGMRVLAFSVITDLCLPDALEPADIDKIIAVAKAGGERLEKLIATVLAKID
ncbi:MAG: purine-nucleoside phosphorylase [Planctomycetota bacterium]|nr:purine-nucleoside phosphorylase [Planctomycetaceae bacterium]MDQ3331099.1 purine-nucleoside phosphorylase [Planctomycetota bacterium]